MSNPTTHTAWAAYVDAGNTLPVVSNDGSGRFVVIDDEAANNAHWATPITEEISESHNVIDITETTPVATAIQYVENITTGEVKTRIDAMNAAAVGTVALNDVIRYLTPGGIENRFLVVGSAGNLQAEPLEVPNNPVYVGTPPTEGDVAPSKRFVVQSASDESQYITSTPTPSFVLVESGSGGSGPNDVDEAYQAWLLANPGGTVAQYVADISVSGGTANDFVAQYTAAKA